MRISDWSSDVCSSDLVRHEIVHNRYVVDSLKAMGATFVESLDQVPDGVPVVFSAHGVPKAVPAKAEMRGLDYIDAPCPLVSKVHRQADRAHDAGQIGRAACRDRVCQYG